MRKSAPPKGKIAILAALPHCGNLPVFPATAGTLRAPRTSRARRNKDASHTMNLHLDNNGSTNIVTGYGADHVMINKVRHDGNLLLTATGIVSGWAPGGYAGLTADDFAAARDLGMEIVLIGTGSRQRFPSPALLRPLIEARIGFEVMDLAAACRTYNILVGEGRAVAAALLFDALA